MLLCNKITEPFTTTNPSCSDKYMVTSIANEIRQSAKCSPNSPFPGLQQHPTSSNSCYMSLDEPILTANGGCSMNNPVLAGVSNLMAAVPDETVDCFNTVCRIQFPDNLPINSRDISTRQLSDANGASTPGMQAVISASAALQSKYDTLSTTYNTTVSDRDTARANLAQCSAGTDLLNSQLTSANNLVQACAVDKASLQSQLNTAAQTPPVVVNNTMPDGSWKDSCQPISYDTITSTLVANCKDGRGGNNTSTKGGCQTFWNSAGTLMCGTEPVPTPPAPPPPPSSNLPAYLPESHFWWGITPQTQNVVTALKAVPAPPPPDPLVTLCDDVNLQGNCVQRATGLYDTAQLGIKNDSMSSIKVPPHRKITLYSDAHFSGPTQVFSGPLEADNFRILKWSNGDNLNDSVSSYKIDAI